jgi:hypothetical protein
MKRSAKKPRKGKETLDVYSLLRCALFGQRRTETLADPYMPAFADLLRELLKHVNRLKRMNKLQARAAVESIYSHMVVQLRLSDGNLVIVSRHWWKNFLDRKAGKVERPQSQQLPLLYGIRVKAKGKPRRRCRAPWLE